MPQKGTMTSHQIDKLCLNQFFYYTIHISRHNQPLDIKFDVSFTFIATKIRDFSYFGPNFAQNRYDDVIIGCRILLIIVVINYRDIYHPTQPLNIMFDVSFAYISAKIQGFSYFWPNFAQKRCHYVTLGCQIFLILVGYHDRDISHATQILNIKFDVSLAYILAKIPNFSYLGPILPNFVIMTSQEASKTHPKIIFAHSVKYLTQKGCQIQSLLSLPPI